MTPLQFEATYSEVWKELEAALDLAENKKTVRPKADPKAKDKPPAKPQPKVLDGAQLSSLYRRACEHLVLAQSRAYPIHLTQRLEELTHRAHRLIYRRHDYGLERLKRLVWIDFPQSVRGLGWYLWVSVLLFTVPLLAAGWATYRDPGFVLHLMDVAQAREYDAMYSESSRGIGQPRSAATDLGMFGFYIKHNIGIGFQCFAGGLFGGLGSVFFLVFNGVQIGGVGGYLTARGHSENFYSFVATHSSFELTAIVLSGAAGLRIGHALLAPGRRTRTEALKHATSEVIVVIYGVIGMLTIAAAIEAFWSSARWLPVPAKYTAGVLCWVFVLWYLGVQGRPRRGSGHAD